MAAAGSDCSPPLGSSSSPAPASAAESLAAWSWPFAVQACPVSVDHAAKARSAISASVTKTRTLPRSRLSVLPFRRMVRPPVRLLAGDRDRRCLAGLLVALALVVPVGHRLTGLGVHAFHGRVAARRVRIGHLGRP